MNDALDDMDPFVESWPFSFEFRDNGVRKSLTMASASRMNILATPAVIPPLAEVLTFSKRCTTIDSLARYSTKGATLQRMLIPEAQGKYTLVNKSGVALTYWAAAESGSSTCSRRFSVMAEETVYLSIHPVSKAVLLPHANTKVGLSW